MNEQAVYQYVVQIDVTRETPSGTFLEPVIWRKDYNRPVDPASLQWCLRQAALTAYPELYSAPAIGQDPQITQDTTLGGHPEDMFRIVYDSDRTAFARMTIRLRKETVLPVPLVDKAERNATVSVAVKFYGIVNVQAGKLADAPAQALIDAVQAGKYSVHKSATVRKASIAQAYPHIPQETLDGLPELIALPVTD